jgi:hypothetical protein
MLTSVNSLRGSVKDHLRDIFEVCSVCLCELDVSVVKKTNHGVTQDKEKHGEDSRP